MLGKFQRFYDVTSPKIGNWNKKKAQDRENTDVKNTTIKKECCINKISNPRKKITLNLCFDGFYFRSFLGTVELFPCIYAFGCRQVILVDGTDTKLLFNGNDEARTITLKSLNQFQAYIVSTVTGNNFS